MRNSQKTQVGGRSNRAIAARVAMCSALKREPSGSRANPERQRHPLSVSRKAIYLWITDERSETNAPDYSNAVYDSAALDDSPAPDYSNAAYDSTAFLPTAKSFMRIIKIDQSIVYWHQPRPFRHCEIRTVTGFRFSQNLRIDGPDTRRGPRSCAFG